MYSTFHSLASQTCDAISDTSCFLKFEARLLPKGHPITGAGSGRSCGITNAVRCHPHFAGLRATTSSGFARGEPAQVAEDYRNRTFPNDQRTSWCTDLGGGERRAAQGHQILEASVPDRPPSRSFETSSATSPDASERWPSEAVHLDLSDQVGQQMCSQAWTEPHSFSASMIR